MFLEQQFQDAKIPEEDLEKRGREAGDFGVRRNPCGAEVGGINSNISRFLFFFLFFLTLSFYISSILVVCNFATYQLEKFLRGLLIY